MLKETKESAKTDKDKKISELESKPTDIDQPANDDIEKDKQAAEKEYQGKITDLNKQIAETDELISHINLRKKDFDPKTIETLYTIGSCWTSKDKNDNSLLSNLQVITKKLKDPQIEQPFIALESDRSTNKLSKDEEKRRLLRESITEIDKHITHRATISYP